MEVEAALREQARGCAALGSPMYAALLDRLADDLAAGGPTARVLAGHEDDPGPSALALRLLGSVHRLVLERRAGAVATYYPSVGGTWDDDAGSAAVVALLDEQPEAVREWLDRPPQTNETGRAVVLLGGLQRLAPELPVRLVELGASGGLNLLADLLHPDRAAGLEVVERLGCDPRPVDVATTEGRLTLTAYVWPDQRERHERLREALRLAQQHAVVVRRCGAAELLAGVEPRDGVVTVVWHSVVRQYLDADERAEVEAHLQRLGAAATDRGPVAHLAMEPQRRTPQSPREMLVTLRAWPHAPEVRVLGVAHPHGVPVAWD
ncbi:DUF2332 domain-containing protein [Nocardioides marmoraquaticus]